MRKPAPFGAAMLIAATAATATPSNPAFDAASGADAACHLGQAADPACVPRAVGDAAAPAPDELVAPAPAPSLFDAVSLHPPGNGLNFQEAAADTGSVLPATVDRDQPPRLASALLALGALVVLLRRRPN